MRAPRRFDDALMTPPDALGAVDAALNARIRRWCEAGAFPTSAPALRVAAVAPHAGLDGAACALDGSHELARLGRWRGLAWRLRLLWRESVAPGAARQQDPWDCGWWRSGVAAVAAAAAFQPRRPTLLMVREPTPADLDALLSALRGNASTYAPAYARPVRLLVVSADPAPGGTAGIERL